ncbi:MAG: iron-sulfur cluster assembly scaffold protein [Nitrososphaerota archaeon]
MSTRTPLAYSPKILELFKNPKNLGRMNDASVVSQAGSPACGDVITIYLKIDGDKIIDSSFESYGCAANIAAASILTEMIKGKTLKEAWDLTWEDVANELGGLPPIKYHCSILAVGGLKRAIRKYFEEIKREKPEWLPKDLSKEERQALEEEELIERMYKKYGVVP